ncbi:MAG: thioredoxin family protein, partial [Muribaculaceae bacterium]|nr:thioredoxin family protein [Muribaculaceae bacterium]
METIREDGEISHPAIIESLENFYRRAYARKSFDIPDDRRGRVIKDLIAPYEGKMLLIDFWGLSCGPCRYAIKNSVVAREKNRSNPDFKMIFISDDTESESQYRDFMTKYLEGEICYRIPESDFRMLRDLFAFSGIPRYVLIGRDGKVLDSDFNFHNMKRDMKGYGIALESDIMDEIASPVET